MTIADYIATAKRLLERFRDTEELHAAYSDWYDWDDFLRQDKPVETWEPGDPIALVKFVRALERLEYTESLGAVQGNELTYDNWVAAVRNEFRSIAGADALLPRMSFGQMWREGLSPEYVATLAVETAGVTHASPVRKDGEARVSARRATRSL